jgi:hypothetical protein
VQEGTNLTQDEVMTLEKPGFLLSRKAKCYPRNLLGDSSSFPINKPADATAWLSTRQLEMGKIFVVLQYSKSQLNNRTSGRLDLF